MELVLLYLLTIILSVYNNLSLVNNTIKDIANLDYRLDLKRIRELQSKFNNNNSNNNLILYTVCPILNIILSTQALITYFKTRNQVLETLDKLDSVYLMDEIELEEYNKKRTGFNALKTWVKTDDLKSNPVIVEDELNKINETISNVKPDLLIVCFGCPKQEKWIYENINKYDAKVSICAGATVDFLAGNMKRAPQWMSEHGLEWFYRFLQEPKRLFKRYFVNDIKILKLIGKYRK